MAHIVSNITLGGSGGGGGSGSSVQSDWNQNNSSADDYIRNRIFYKVNQALTGAIDGVNNLFTVNESFNVDTEQLFNNGVLLKKPDDYNITGVNIILTFSPAIDETLTINYTKQ